MTNVLYAFCLFMLGTHLRVTNCLHCSFSIFCYIIVRLADVLPQRTKLRWICCRLSNLIKHTVSAHL